MEENKKEKKFTYEELEGICSQLSEQNRILLSRINKDEQEEFHKWLNYLFRVLENSDKFDSKFVQECVANIVTGLTPDSPNNKEEK